MHKRIVDAIIESINRKEDLVKTFVDDKQTGGFWKLLVAVKPGYEHLIPHIKNIGISIGDYYGERLSVDVWNNTIEFG